MRTRHFPPARPVIRIIRPLALWLMTKPTRCRANAMILFLLLLRGAASADDLRLSTPNIQQQQAPQWCWAASIQNCLAYYGVSVDQKQIVTATYGTLVNLPLFDPRQAVANLLSANSLVAPQGRVVHPFLEAGPPVPAVLVRELKRERSPMIAMYQNPAGGGHAVVCYGAEYQGPDQAPTVTKVFVSDPWDASRKEWAGVQLASLWSATVYLRVAPQPKQNFQFQSVSYYIAPDFLIYPVGYRVPSGRAWYFREDSRWHMIGNLGDIGPIP